IASLAEPASWRNARMSLVGDGVSLEISGTRFVTLPNFQFFFGDLNQSLNVHANSTFDYYGLPQGDINHPAGPVITNFLGAGQINLVGGSVNAGTGAHDPPSQLNAPAVLNVHGGANFKIPETIQFTSTNSKMEFPFESSIVPMGGIPNNPSVTGIASLH